MKGKEKEGRKLKKKKEGKEKELGSKDIWIFYKWKTIRFLVPLFYAGRSH